MERVVIPEQLQLVESPIQESYSAKEPDVRPEFRRLIESIKSGRITGVIAWHPDRLARNMKEAGELIDLLDKGTLKDLRFATFTFENNPTGKMLLGISFVLSKQYSEHLSESVNRGNQYATETDGEFIGKMKHGYYVDTNRRLQPDGDNFLIVKRIFQMRLDGATQIEIRNWLNTTNYQVRKYKKDPINFEWDKDDVSKVLRDPVYAGVLKYGQHLVNLTEKYDFTPMVTVPQFLKLNKISELNSSKLVSSMKVKGGEIQANLLRGIVVCGFCNKPFSSGLTHKKLKDGLVRYYNYKCETQDCSFRGKSVRAKVVLEYAQDFFKEHLFITEENYDEYVKDAKKDIAQRTKVLNSTIASLSKLSGEKEVSYQKAKDFVLKNEEFSKHYELDKMKAELDGMKQRMEELKEQRSTLKQSIMTYEKYLELFKNVSVILADMRDMEPMDQLLRKFFSNFTIKDHGKSAEQRYEISYYLNEPWLGFIKNNKFVHGRGERTRTFDLTVPNRAR